MEIVKIKANSSPDLMSKTRHTHQVACPPRLMRVETHPNGGASVVYLHQRDVDMLSAPQQESLAKEFLKVHII